MGGCVFVRFENEKPTIIRRLAAIFLVDLGLKWWIDQ